MSKDAETTDALYPLSDRIAALDGPHKGVDVEIALAMGWQRWTDEEGAEYWEAPDGFDCTYLQMQKAGYYTSHRWMHPPRYTGSLDAAMALVPDDCQNHVLLSISPMSLDMGGRNWKAQVGKSRAAGRTPALALAAAAMKARGL